MNTIKAVVRNGRLETDAPLDLPEGTELLIPIPGHVGDDENNWDNSSERIAAWLDWADSLAPLTMTEHEFSESEDWMKQCDRLASGTLGTDLEGLF